MYGRIAIARIEESRDLLIDIVTALHTVCFLTNIKYIQ